MLSEEEKNVIDTFKQGYGITDAERRIILNLIEKQQQEINNLKEIEKSHQEENGKLRVELEQEKEKNKELEYQNKILQEKNQDYKCNYDTMAKQKEALEKQHEYDMQMIDEVKGNAVKWANELEQEKEKNKSLKKQIKEMQEYYKNADFIFKDKIKEIQGQLYMQLGSYVRNEASPEQERIAGGINIINKILKGE